VADVTNFADVYIGAAASDPATRADSSALEAGELYYNTATDDMKVYSGSAWAVVAPTATSITESQISDLGDSIVLDTDIGSTVQAFDAGIVKKNVNNTFTAAQRGSTDTDTTNTGDITLDFDTNQNFVLTLTGNITLKNPSTESVGQSGFIVFIQDATGGRTVSLESEYKTAGGVDSITLSTAASTTDLVPYIVSASGSILLGAPQLAFS